MLKEETLRDTEPSLCYLEHEGDRRMKQDHNYSANWKFTKLITKNWQDKQDDEIKQL